MSLTDKMVNPSCAISFSRVLEIRVDHDAAILGESNDSLHKKNKVK